MSESDDTEQEVSLVDFLTELNSKIEKLEKKVERIEKNIECE